MLVISGQVKRADLIGDSGVRQMGPQEVDIVAMVRPITKYAVTVLDPTRSAIIWNGASTRRPPAGAARCGSTFRSTCRPRPIDPESLSGFTRAAATINTDRIRSRRRTGGDPVGRNAR